MNDYIQQTLLVLLIVFGMHANMHAQMEPLSSQYMNNKLVVNPAYAGMHNSLSTSIASRQQWQGIVGAPKTTTLTVHSPINKSYASIGGLIKSNETGPVKNLEVEIDYSYLIKFSSPAMLSLGLSAGISSTTVGLASLELINNQDPYFSQDIENKINPNFGFGGYFYTPILYVGFSIPKLLTSTITNSQAANSYTAFATNRTYYLSGGYAHIINKKWQFKPSMLMRFASGTPLSMDVSGQIFYKSIIGIGASVRLNQTAVALLDINIGKNLEICYSYDLPINTTSYYNHVSHEITLTYDIHSFYKKSDHRRFSKKTPDTPEEIRSLRFF